MPLPIYFTEEVISTCLNEHLNKTAFECIINEGPKTINISAWDKFRYMIGATKLILHVYTHIFHMNLKYLLIL